MPRAAVLREPECQALEHENSSEGNREPSVFVHMGVSTAERVERS